MKNKILAVIPAAGSSERFNSEELKQYADCGGRSVLEMAVSPFLDSEIISKVIICISTNDTFIKNQNFINDPKILLIEGGSTRAHSVLNALEHEEFNDYQYAIVHDAARPNITEADINKIHNDIVSNASDCTILYQPLTQSIKQASKNIDKTLDRSKYYLVQTPNISKLDKLRDLLKNLINKNIEVPDESFVFEFSNLKITKVLGRSSNIKITFKEDLELVRKFSTRIGTGFDLHKFIPGKGILLGGHYLACDYDVEAHSDGDVLLHSIADSILGASAQGDIGYFFSDKDEKNKNIDSKEIINFCIEKLNELELEIYNLDTTIICEYPKINPHRDEIIKSLSKILKISESKIGLKATTSEKIGIIGKNKAIAVQSAVNLKKIK